MPNKAALPTRKACFLKGALAVALAPRMAQDAKVPLDAILAGVTDANFKDRKAKIAADLKNSITPQLAKDANAEGLAELLDALEKQEIPEGKDTETAPNAALPIKKPENEAEKHAPWEKVRGMLKDKGMDAEMLKACDAEMGYEEPVESEDENLSEEERKKREEEEKAKGKDKKGKDEEPVTKKAMDAAIKATRDQVLADQKALREAENFVRPWIGEIAIAQDSAPDVYKLALTTLKPDLDLSSTPPAAFKAMLELIPKPGKKSEQHIAQDSADGRKSFFDAFPVAKRLVR